MADWPVDGVTNWNQKMKANIDVGHDSDGTHTKSQMLLDMEWSPLSYAGGESITLPNGLIIKAGALGSSIVAGASDTVTYGTAFPNAIVAVNITVNGYSGGPQMYSLVLTASSITAFTVKNTDNDSTASDVYWMAIGY